MKLDNNKSKVQTDQPELVRQAKKQTEYRKVGDHIKSIDGGKVFKINKETGDVSEALYRIVEEITLGEAINGPAPRKIDVEPGHWYVEALNAKNASKKLSQNKIILST